MRNTIRYTSPLLVSLIVFISPEVRAQNVDPIESSLEELTGKEVSSVSKTDQTANETLATLTIIRAEDIERYGYRTLGDALARVNGLNVTNDRAYTYLGVRGLSVPGDYGGRVLLLVDGHRINDTNYDYFGLHEDFPVDVRFIDRIEISKGTGSAVWGVNAVFATINVITKQGRVTAGGQGGLEYGEFNRRKAYALVGDTTRDGIEYSAGAAVSRSDGQPSVYIPSFDAPETNHGVQRHSDGFEAKRASLRVEAKGVQLLVNGSTRTKYYPGASYDSLFTEQSITTDDVLTAEVNATRELTDSSKVVARVYHDWIDYRSFTPFAGEDTPAPRINYDEGSTRRMGTELRISGGFLDRFHYVAGTEIQNVYRARINSEYLDPFEPLLHNNGTYRLKSGYAEGTVAFSPSVSLIGGARLDKYSSWKSQFNPRTGVIYHLDPRRSLKLMYGTAFRIPNTYERLYQSYGSSTSSLDPEHGKGYELIYLHNLGPDHRLQVSAYHYQLSDIISSVESMSPTGDPSFLNLGTAESDGAELWWNYGDADGLSSYAGATYQRAVNDANQTLAAAPRVMLTSGVSVPFERYHLFLSPEARFVSRTKTTQDGWISSTVITNITLRYKPSAKGFDASLSVYNLFGANDPQVVSPAFRFDRIPSEGRTYRIQIGYSF